MFLHQHSVDFNLKTEACFPPRPMHADQVDGRNELLFSLPVCLKTEFQIKTCEYTCNCKLANEDTLEDTLPEEYVTGAEDWVNS